MRRGIKVIVHLLWIVPVVVLLVPAGTAVGVYLSADMGQPEVSVDTADYPLVRDSGYLSCRGSFLRRSESGLWEQMLVGDALQRGVASGRLCHELLYFQEKAFVDQIRQFVPSDRYLRFLRFLTIVFNRNMGQYVPEEYRREIYGISLSATHEYDAIGTPYERQLNYHAAHDIGHAMQEYMLVGCTSFAVWGAGSADTALVVGRNFDFYVGDDFARNKIVTFCCPEQGYRFASVGWAGMIGVLSGMNETGLTVTINAAKGSIPLSAAMPISLLAREILQYASTIEEAYRIASQRRTFVSESLLIASARDGRAAVIEKTPRQIALYEGEKDRVVCTNHYRSALLGNTEQNLENMATTDSRYRQERVEELLNGAGPLTAAGAVALLRDRYGKGGVDIGLGNEKSINQSIAHHSVVFRPESRLMWVSTGPWQSGQFVCYDLNRIFASPDFSRELTESDLTVAADSLFLAEDYPALMRYRMLTRELRETIDRAAGVPDFPRMEEYLTTNPNYYYTYQLAGEYYRARGENDRARDCFLEALQREIPRLSERQQIENELKSLEP